MWRVRRRQARKGRDERGRREWRRVTWIDREERDDKLESEG